MNTTTTKPSPAQLISRALWLAFQASAPVGMGMLHISTANQQTEESLFNAMNDEPPAADGSLRIYTDYVAGRMMKTDFKVSPDGVLTIRPEIPRSDYHSWAGTYRSAAELVAAVEKSFA